jgi:hypothetical protein
MADVTTAREQVTDYDRPRDFAYRTGDYTFTQAPIERREGSMVVGGEGLPDQYPLEIHTFQAKGAVTAALLTLSLLIAEVIEN